MKRIYTLFLVALSSIAIAQPKAYEPTSPQVVYEMYIEVVEPIHKAYEAMGMTDHKPVLNAEQMASMFKRSAHKLETFHKERLHRDAYTAAKTYLEGMTVINDSLLIPLMVEMEGVQTQDELGPMLERLHSISLEEVHFADEYITAIKAVIELFKKDWDKWLQQEIIFFSRLTAQERNAIYQSGFGEKGLHPVKRRFYTAEYFAVNMEKDVTDSRVNSITASFKDLSDLPEYMVNNVDEFIEQFDVVLGDYRYVKTEKEGGDKILYNKGAETDFMFSVKSVEITIISRTSNTVKVKFHY